MLRRLILVSLVAMFAGFFMTATPASAGGTADSTSNISNAHLDLAAGTATFTVKNVATTVGVASYNCAPSGCGDLTSQVLVAGSSHLYQPSDVPYVVKLTTSCGQNDLFVGELIEHLSPSNRYGSRLLDVKFGENCTVTTPTPSPTPTTPSPTPTTPSPSPTSPSSSATTPSATPSPSSSSTSPSPSATRTTTRPTRSPSQSELAKTGGSGGSTPTGPMALVALGLIAGGIALVKFTPKGRH